MNVNVQGIAKTIPFAKPMEHTTVNTWVARVPTHSSLLGVETIIKTPSSINVLLNAKSVNDNKILANERVRTKKRGTKRSNA